MRAPFPVNEAQRLQALHNLDLLDTPKERDFDDIALVAARACGVPIAAITLVDAERQWFKACVGMDLDETPRDVAFCAHTLLEPEGLTFIEDALADSRFVDNPLVTGEPGIRFYAGAPLVTREGLVIGALCLVDVVPRRLSVESQELLQALARQVMQQICLRQTLVSLKKTSRQLHMIADSVPVLIGQLDDAGRYCFCNRKYQDWWGLVPEQLLGKTPAEILPPGIAQQLQPFLARCYDGEELAFELNLDAGRTAVVHYIPEWRDGRVVGLFVLASDISQRKQVEELKNAFVSSVSHELRTPLTSISGALGLLLHGQLGSVTDPQKNLLNIAYQNSQRLMYLINDLLDMEKLLAGKMQFDLRSLPLSALLEKSLYENTTYAESYQVRFRLDHLAADLRVRVDEQRFLQIMANLLSNAVKYSPQGSVVEVASERLATNEVRIKVKDKGPGIAPEFQARLFQKFSQADTSAARQKGGTGLGLAISRELVEKMAGHIGFFSPPEGGSCFYLDLPLDEFDPGE